MPVSVVCFKPKISKIEVIPSCTTICLFCIIEDYLVSRVSQKFQRKSSIPIHSFHNEALITFCLHHSHTALDDFFVDGIFVVKNESNLTIDKMKMLNALALAHSGHAYHSTCDVGRVQPGW